ncbi:MAG: carbamoyltransferase HypF [Candidatus Heimdallarchaeota archaeon]
MTSRVRIACRGIVQGIGFRPFVYRIALDHKLVGFVRNQGDAGVIIIAEGSKVDLESFVNDLHEKKPHLTKYEDFQVEWEKSENKFSNFNILKSSETKAGGISYLPPDISICSDCLDDMKNPKDTRYNYPFTSCVICGPRYTTITKLPYDRPHTTMDVFPLCDSCRVEYENPLDRRHHAQTTCCSICGPSLSLFDRKGSLVECTNILKETAKQIQKGKIVAIKGIGGTHLACSATDNEVILRLRTKKGKRKYKPFALISNSITDIKKFAEIENIEEQILTSYRKPIVLLKKKNPFILSKWVSPDLFNVGVMLPYSGIHSLILDEISDPAIILTSANPTDIPMYVENEKILSKAADLADFFLLHNREIHQRADDSVIRLTNSNPVLIRRSRGWVPEPINLPFDLKDEKSLGVGPLLTSTGAIAYKNRCFLTQHIGNVDTLETLDFLKSSLEHLSKLLGISNYTSIGCDLHPNFLSTALAKEYASEFESNLIKIQHHHAHAVALMIDNKLSLTDEIVAIVADGVGYGDDEKIWGGEILHSSYTTYERIYHLEEQIMVGGDRATYYPIRMFAGILSKVMDTQNLREILENKYLDSFPGRYNEIQVLLVQLEKKINLFETTSTGRILASLSSLLGFCSERTYEGEPAIKLESFARLGSRGKIKFKVPSPSEDTIYTTPLIVQSYEFFNQGKNPFDIALAAHYELANQFANASISYAKENNIRKIGITGGVAYNQFITSHIAKKVKQANLEFIEHKDLPCGDGAISCGQAIVSALQNRE